MSACIGSTEWKCKLNGDENMRAGGASGGGENPSVDSKPFAQKRRSELHALGAWQHPLCEMIVVRPREPLVARELELALCGLVKNSDVLQKPRRPKPVIIVPHACLHKLSQILNVMKHKDVGVTTLKLVRKRRRLSQLELWRLAKNTREYEADSRVGARLVDVSREDLDAVRVAVTARGALSVRATDIATRGVLAGRLGNERLPRRAR